MSDDNVRDEQQTRHQLLACLDDVQDQLDDLHEHSSAVVVSQAMTEINSLVLRLSSESNRADLAEKAMRAVQATLTGETRLLHEQADDVRRLLEAMSPRQWSVADKNGPSARWHRAIPDVQLAFDRLRAWALKDDNYVPRGDEYHGAYPAENCDCVKHAAAVEIPPRLTKPILYSPVPGEDGLMIDTDYPPGHPRRVVERRVPESDELDGIEPCPHGFVMLAGTCPKCDAERKHG